MSSRSLLPSLAVLALLSPARSAAQLPQSLQEQMQHPILTEHTTQISDHVWAIMGFPNIAIIVGERATLVVDTGLGPRNGATVARVAAKLARGPKLFLTTTHFHPEHASGEAGFPPGTILIRNHVQQQEMDAQGVQMLDVFRRISPQYVELLNGVKALRPPDITFENETRVDLGGGVRVRLLWLGPGHTKGDELTFVEPDRTLVSGDLVQNKVVPGIGRDGGTASSWIAVLDKLAPLNVRHVLPDHSPPGDGSLIAAERNFLNDVRTRALALKRQGVAAGDAGKQLNQELKTKYSDWPDLNVTGLVQRIYAEGN
jgi:glyoxylase-like metal-dependent hydrolase (beta-lactamase superfamily II)